MATPGISRGLVLAISSVLGFVIPLAITYQLVRVVTAIRGENADASDENDSFRAVGDAVLAVMILPFAWTLYVSVLCPFSTVFC